MIDLEQRFNSIEPKKPNYGTIVSLQIDSMPVRAEFRDDLVWVCANLRNTIFITSPNEKGIAYDLIPVSPHDYVAGFPMALFTAWNDEELRNGYLPQTPHDYPHILDVISKWLKDPNTVVYRTTNSEDPNNIGFFHLQFNHYKSCLKAEVSYGNINPRQLRKKHMSNALAILIEGLQAETKSLGFPLTRVETSVSDANVGSQKILRNNGFQFDASNFSGRSSPIVMGGLNIPVALDLSFT